MSQQDSKNEPSNITTMVGIIFAIIVAGGVVMYISMSSPEVAETVYSTFNINGCGENTFYHESTNTCELYPEVKQASDHNEKLKEDVERIVRDIILDQDGKRVVEMDDEGLPVVSCTPFEDANFIIDEHCQMTQK